MTTDKIDDFNQKAIALFQAQLEKYGYILDEIKENEINGTKWSTHHIYLNSKAGLKLVIIQEPYNTEYGFSVFIYRLGTTHYNILYNVPHEVQDSQFDFLARAFEDLFSTPETLDLISGKSRKQLGYIAFQK